MNSTRPYLIRAMYEWMLDNNMTPYVLVDTTKTGVQIPRQYERDGKIVLNISTAATERLIIGNQELSFAALFDGSPMNVLVPINSILAIYTRENSRGMMFGEERDAPSVVDPRITKGLDEDPSGGPKPTRPRRPRLKVVK